MKKNLIIQEVGDVHVLCGLDEYLMWFLNEIFNYLYQMMAVVIQKTH